MKVATGGWVADVPEAVAFIEINVNEPGTRPTLTFYDDESAELPGPDWDLLPEPDHWTRRVKA